MARKYIIELVKESFFDGGTFYKTTLWLVKGFRTLVFDEYGLQKLKPLYEDTKEINVGDTVKDPADNMCYVTNTDTAIHVIYPCGKTHKWKKKLNGWKKLNNKFVIELEDFPYVPYGSVEGGDKLWRVKGFKSLVLTEDALNKLTPYKEGNIEIGDEIENGGVKCIVADIDGGFWYGIGKNGKEFGTYEYQVSDMDQLGWHKTGRHVDLDMLWKETDEGTD